MSRCQQCGAYVGIGMASCGVCGASLGEDFDINSGHEIVIDKQKSAWIGVPLNYRVKEEQTEDDIESTFIGPHADYYLEQFHRLTHFGTKIGWNWGALLFGPWWFIYRKMYRYALAFILLFALTIPSRFGPILVFILSAVFADYLYLQYVQERLNTIRPMSEPRRNIELHLRGGTDMAGAVLVLIVPLIIAACTLFFARMIVG